MKEELKQSSWNKNKKTKKGVRGFLKVPESEQMNKVITIKFTNEQRKFLRYYCKKEKISISDLVRFMLYNHLKENQQDFSIFETKNTNNMIDLSNLEGEVADLMLQHENGDIELVKVRILDVCTDLMRYYDGWNENITITCNLEPLETIPKGFDIEDFQDVPLDNLINGMTWENYQKQKV